MTDLSHLSPVGRKQPSNEKWVVVRNVAAPTTNEGMLMLGVAIVLTVAMFIIAFTMTNGAIAQLQLGSYTSNRDGALQGALAGVQAMVANIRAASSGGYVVLDQLPCNNVSGLTDTSGSPSFITSVQYQDQNSQGGFTSVTCTQGKGPASAGTGEYLAQAIITSCSPASACPTQPHLRTQWQFHVAQSRQHLRLRHQLCQHPGGLINSYSGKECFEAIYNNGSNTSGGVTLGVTTSCSTTNILEQFQYTTNWNLAIELGGVEYCVQDSEDETPAVASPVPITTPCTSTAVAQWGVNDSGGIRRGRHQWLTGGPAEQLLPEQSLVQRPERHGDRRRHHWKLRLGIRQHNDLADLARSGSRSVATTDRPGIRRDRSARQL